MPAWVMSAAERSPACDCTRGLIPPPMPQVPVGGTGPPGSSLSQDHSKAITVKHQQWLCDLAPESQGWEDANPGSFLDRRGLGHTVQEGQEVRPSDGAELWKGLCSRPREAVRNSSGQQVLFPGRRPCSTGEKTATSTSYPAWRKPNKKECGLPVTPDISPYSLSHAVLTVSKSCH